MKVLSLLVFLILVSSCDNEKDAPQKEEQIDFNGSLTHDGEERTYRVHLPVNYYETDGSFPLVLAFHGGGGSGEQFATQSELMEKADAENFIVVFPDGLVNPNFNVRTWNAGKCCGANASYLDTDDIGFVSKLIDELIGDFKVDQKRVYATGHSNGAMLSLRIANELSTKIAAVAANAGNFQIEEPYDPQRPVPVLLVISKLDQNVKYEGGMTEGPGGQYNPPIDSCLTVIARHAGCNGSKTLIDQLSTYGVYTWVDCAQDNFEVLYYLTEDGGHSWPGGNKGSVFADQPLTAFKNNDVIWDFFNKHSLP